VLLPKWHVFAEDKLFWERNPKQSRTLIKVLMLSSTEEDFFRDENGELFGI